MVLVAASVAWGCSAVATIDCAGSSTRTEGPAGTRVMINGCSFYNDQPVEIRWDSETGPVLAKATGPEFSVGVNVPATATVGKHAGFYVVFRYTDAEGGAVRRQLQSQFTVTPAAASTAGNAPSQVTSGSGSGGEGFTPAVEQQAPAPAPAATPATPIAETTGALTAAPAPVTASPSAGPSAVRTPAGRVVFGGSTPPESAPAAAAGQPAVAADEESAAVPARTASGDLWSGFRSGPDTRALGLDDSLSGSGSSAGVMAMLFLAALVALSFGFGVAELSRRRVLAHAGDRTHRP